MDQGENTPDARRSSLPSAPEPQTQTADPPPIPKQRSPRGPDLASMIHSKAIRERVPQETKTTLPPPKQKDKQTNKLDPAKTYKCAFLRDPREPRQLKP